MLSLIHILPKTIDNDIYGTDMTFGFQSAVNIATNAIDCIHTTATSHGRVFIVEIMGHKVGSLTLHAGIAGGADIILIPEIPYDIEKVCAAIEKRNKAGKSFKMCIRDRNEGGVTVLPPYEKSTNSEWYTGTANAIFQNLDYMQPVSYTHLDVYKRQE